MSEQELNFHAIAQRLAAAPASEPAPDLWARIAHAHASCRQRRRRQRLVDGGIAVLVILATFAAAVRLPGAIGTDWQARAQALEIQLHARTIAADGSDNSLT